LRRTLPPDSSSQADTRQKMETLQAQLAARASVLHFAHSAVSTIVALILGGAAGKLFWDLEPEQLPLAVLAATVSGLLLVYAFVRYLLGRKAYQVERHRFEALKDLRRALSVDDPSTLLPQ
jgi:hypothetical protein